MSFFKYGNNCNASVVSFQEEGKSGQEKNAAIEKLTDEIWTIKR